MDIEAPASPEQPNNPQQPSSRAAEQPATAGAGHAARAATAAAAKANLVETVRAAPVAMLLIAINLIVFALVERTGNTTQSETLIRFGATWRGLVWQGEYWRLVTSMFLHIGIIRSSMNSVTSVYDAQGAFRVRMHSQRSKTRHETPAVRPLGSSSRTSAA